MEEKEITMNDTVVEEYAVSEKPNKEKKPKKIKEKLLKNTRLAKKGWYSVAVIAAVLAVIILLNVLLGVLGNRVNIELDISKDKSNTISEENLEYIKNIESDIYVYFTASEDNYASAAANTLYSSYYISDDYSDYYAQTITLAKKYHEYNSKISIEFIDMYSDSEYSAIKTKYSNESISYGDIIVSDTPYTDSENTGRYKILEIDDVYDIAEDSSSSYYSYYSSYTLNGNNIETALTSGMVYVLGNDSKVAGIVTGHTNVDVSTYLSAYASLLDDNNIEVIAISDSLISSIDETVDLLVLMAPTIDFTDNEISLIADFLDNDGKYGKGLVFFGSSECPYLENLYSFIAEWGIEIYEGKLYETDSSLCSAGDPFNFNSTYYGYYPLQSGDNLPVMVSENLPDDISAGALGSTQGSEVVAPLSASTTWTDYNDSDKDTFATIAMSKKTGTDSNGDEITSIISVFSSLDFVTSEAAEQSGIYNKDLTLAISESSIQAEDTGISFVSKSITDESFSASVTDASSALMQTLFMFLLPIVMIACGIIVYVNRRKSK